MKKLTPPMSAFVMVSSSVFLSALAQLLFRYGMKNIGLTMDFGHFYRSLSSMIDWFASPYGVSVSIGILMYGLSLVCWLVALRRLNLSFAYPLLSLSYILVYLGAVYWPGLGEVASWNKAAGIVLIVVGVILVSLQKNRQL